MENDGVITFESAKQARVLVSREIAKLARGQALLMLLDGITLGRKQLIRANMDMHTHEQQYFDGNAVDTLTLEQIQSSGDSFMLKQRILLMSDETVKAAEVIEASTALMRTQLNEYVKVGDAAISEAKKRTSQLTDYTHRLSVAMNNLNRVLGSTEMAVALQNAEKITTALRLLEEMEKSGNLSRIMSSLLQEK
jgi:hypothetical protein